MEKFYKRQIMLSVAFGSSWGKVPLKTLLIPRIDATREPNDTTIGLAWLCVFVGLTWSNLDPVDPESLPAILQREKEAQQERETQEKLREARLLAEMCKKGIRPYTPEGSRHNAERFRKAFRGDVRRHPRTSGTIDLDALD